jgi:hypothetical protein
MKQILTITRQVTLFFLFIGITAICQTTSAQTKSQETIQNQQ